MGRFDFVWARPDFAGTAAHDCGFVGEGSHYPIEIVVSKGRIVCFEQSANWFQLGVLGSGLGFGCLRTRNGWNCGGGSDGSYSHNGFFSVHNSDYSSERIRSTIVERSSLSHDFASQEKCSLRQGFWIRMHTPEKLSQCDKF